MQTHNYEDKIASLQKWRPYDGIVSWTFATSYGLTSHKHKFIIIIIIIIIIIVIVIVVGVVVIVYFFFFLVSLLFQFLEDF